MKSLAENESKMADNAHCLYSKEVEIGHLLNTFERRVHELVLFGIIICAEQNCITQGSEILSIFFMKTASCNISTKIFSCNF